jgi:hypothetical protein
MRRRVFSVSNRAGEKARAPVTFSLSDGATAASGGAKLLKLAVKGLPVGGHAGIADQAFFRGEFRS